jgi:hypothetical protein
MNKRNQILVAVLVVQLALAVFVFWPRATASSGSGESLFPDLQADPIVALTITDANGQSIDLAKVGDGWVLPNADDYPAEADRVSDLLTTIAGLKTNRLVTQTSTSLKRLGVAADDFQRLIEFRLADGTEHRLYLGTQPSYSASHVRADDETFVYLASNLSATNAGVNATSWVSADYVSLPREEAAAVTVENANGRLEFVKEGDTWTMAGLAPGETADETAVNTLVNKALYTSLLRPLGKEEKDSYGLGQPSAVVTVQTHSDSGDETYTLWVGAKDEEANAYVVKSSSSEYYVLVSQYSVNDFVEKGHEDLLQLPPTPTPEAGATPSGS